MSKLKRKFLSVALCVLATVATLFGVAGIGNATVFADAATQCSTSIVTASKAAESIMGDAVEVENVSFQGSSEQLGVFETPEGMGLPFNKGIVLSTGSVSSIYSTDGSSLDMGGVGDSRLTKLYNASGYSGSTNDAALLRFSLVPKSPYLSFQYFFTSTEYNQSAKYNDIFALWIIDDMGTEVTTDDEWFNIALLPDGNIVSIQTTVARSASGGMAYTQDGKYYNTSSGHSVNGYPFGFIGYTPLFTADATSLRNSKNEQVVKIGKKISFCFAIADAADHVCDSAVFIKANSLDYSTNNQDITKQLSIRTTTVDDINELLYVQPELSFGTMDGVSSQWYVSQDNVTFTPIEGATNEYYYVPTNLGAGTYYYKCISSKGTQTMESNVATITVLPKSEEAEICTVKFDACADLSYVSNMPSACTVVQGSTIPSFNGISHEMYTFAGWYSDKEYTQAFGVDSKVTSDITLYAKWEEVLNGLEIVKTPVKTHYCNLADIDLSEIEVKATFKSGAEKDVSTDIFVTDYNDSGIMIGYTYNEVTVKTAYAITTGHRYESAETVDGSCSANGYVRFVCSKCGGEKFEVIEATGHQWKLVSSKEATCEESGYNEYICNADGCGESKREELPAKGHAWGPVAVYHEPTCTENGYWDVTCDTCGKTGVATHENSALGHTYDEGTVIVQATCQQAGVISYNCTREGCRYGYTAYLPEAHNYETVNVVDATCTEDGVAKYVCGTCKEPYEKTLEALGHDYTYADNDDGTHTATCARGDDTYVEEHHDGRRVCVCGYRNSAYIEVLLIQDKDPWATQSNERVLEKLQKEGHIDSWVKCTTTDVLNGKVTFANYSLILFANDQGQAMYNNYAKFAKALETYVEQGGALVFGACDSGWLTGRIEVALPGGATTGLDYDRNNKIVDATNPIVTGEYGDGVSLLEEQLHGNYCSHNYFTNVPANANVIFENSDGQATLIEYALGSGYVIASGLTWEFYAHRTGYVAVDFADVAYDDLILAALSNVGAYSFDRHLVEFTDHDGKLLFAQRVEKDDAPALPEAPEREGYEFLGWDVDGDGVADYVDELPAIKVTIVFKAVYAVKNYNVNVSFGENGAVSGAGSYEYGETVALSAKPKDGYTFNGWYLNGECVSMDVVFLYTVGAADADIECRFRSNGVMGEAQMSASQPSYKQGERIVVYVTLKNLKEEGGIYGYILEALQCNGFLLFDENGPIGNVTVKFVGEATGWTIAIENGVLEILNGGYDTPIMIDGELIVEISFEMDLSDLSLAEPMDVKLTMSGSGVSGKGKTCEVDFAPLSIRLTCGHGSTYVEGFLAPTCTADGFTGDTICSVCMQTVEAGVKTEKTEHGYHEFRRNEATCTADGSVYERCESCNDVRLSETLPMKGHTDGEWLPRYDENGEIVEEYKECPDCKETITRDPLQSGGEDPNGGNGNGGNNGNNNGGNGNGGSSANDLITINCTASVGMSGAVVCLLTVGGVLLKKKKDE